MTREQQERGRMAAWDLESLLRSPWKRAALAALLVVALAALNAGHLHQMFEARRLEVDWSRLFAQQLFAYGTWALAGWPLFRLAQLLRRWRRSWFLFFALQIPLSIALAAGAALLHEEVQDRMVSPAPAGRERGPTGEEIAQREGDGPREGRELREPPPPPGEQGERPPGPRRGRGGPRGFGARRPSAWERLFFVGRTRDNVAIYWMVLGIGAIASTFLAGRDRERLAAELSLRASRMQTELARAQLGSLREQLQPHFIFNALHTVGALVQQDKGAEATRVLIALGDLLRTSLEYGDRQEVSLREELSVAESYLGIERVRFGDRLVVSIEAEPGCLEARVPVMLLQPLLENAVRHGIAPRTEGGRIEVRARREGDRLVLRVRDDGPGFPPEQQGAARGRLGIGLANVRERMALLYGEEQELALSNDPDGGAVVALRIPYHTEERHG